MCLAGAVVVSWSLTSEVANSSPTTVITYIDRPQRSCGQGYVFTRVCDSVHRGICLSACLDTTPCQGDPLPRRLPCQGDPPAKETPQPRRPLPRRPPCQGDPPAKETPLPRRPPCKETPPPPGSRLRHTVNERPVRILLECILV